MSEMKEVKEALNQFVEAKQKLRSLDVIRSERVTGEIGEWFAEQLTGAKRAKSSTQKGWDLTDGKKKYQVKTHAKGDDNNARWTTWKYNNNEFDELILLVFSKEFRLKEAYQIPYKVTQDRVDFSKKRVVLRWDDFKDFKIAISPNDDLAVFIET